MMLYHGSYLAVEKPDISFSRDNVDFGKGFYTTPIYEQAVSWSKRFKRIHGKSVVSAYEVDEISLRSNASVKEFPDYSDEWLEFVISSRCGNYIGGYDVVIGGVANDKVFNTIQLLLDGLIEMETAIKRLSFEQPNIQYCFRKQAVLNKYLKFMSSEVV